MATPEAPTPNPTPEKPKNVFSGLSIPWYFVTRAVGASMLFYGIVLDETGERGTIILAGAGFLGVDKVARSEPSK